MHDNLSNMLSIIKNGYNARLSNVVVPITKLSLNVLDALERGGYIRGYRYIRNENMRYVEILLRYNDNNPSIREITRVSSSGRRMYIPYTKLKSHLSGLGSYIISSSRGVLLDTEAKSLGIGGELLCRIY